MYSVCMCGFTCTFITAVLVESDSSWKERPPKSLFHTLWVQPVTEGADPCWVGGVLQQGWLPALCQEDVPQQSWPFWSAPKEKVFITDTPCSFLCFVNGTCVVSPVQFTGQVTLQLLQCVHWLNAHSLDVHYCEWRMFMPAEVHLGVLSVDLQVVLPTPADKVLG